MDKNAKRSVNVAKLKIDSLLITDVKGCCRQQNDLSTTFLYTGLHRPRVDQALHQSFRDSYRNT